MRRRLAIAAVLTLVTTAVLADMYQDASNAKLPEALTNFGYGDKLAASAICTTTSGSTAVTACPSTAGIAVGMVVKGTGIPAGATVAGGITATGFTLSAAATASSATALLTIRHLPFWAEDGGEPSMWRYPGRIMLGNASGQSSSRFTNPSNLTICATGPTCAGWAARDSDLAVISSRGAMAITGMSRTSDGGGIASPPATIGVSGFAIGDALRAVPASAGWASYWDVQLDPAADGSVMMGMEIALKNKGGNYTTSPYHGAAGIVGIRLSPGGDPNYGGSNVNPINTGILFGPIVGSASTRFNKGIVFNNLSLVGTDGLAGSPCCGTAIEMAKGHMIAWKTADELAGGSGFVIHSAVTTGGAGMQLAAANNALLLLGDGGSSRVLEVLHTPTAVNTIQVFDAVAGTAPGVSVNSTSDTNVGLALKPQGTGTVNPAQGLKLPNYTVATLPACNAGYTYVMAAVSDATAPTYNATVTGGGAVKVPVMCDGAAWKAH